MTLLEAPRAEAVTVRRRRRPWLAGAAALALGLAAVAAWLFVGLTPHLGGGSTWNSDPEALVKPAEFTHGPDEQVVRDPSDGSVDGEWSFRNEGRTTVVVTAAPQELEPLVLDVQLRLVPPGGGGPIADADAVTVGPGQQFGVRYSFALGCAPYGPGTGAGIDVVRLRVTTLGLARTLEVPVDQPLTYLTATGHTPPAGCGES